MLQVSTELRDLFTYDIWPFWLLVILLATLIIFKKFFTHYRPRPRITTLPAQPTAKDKNHIKQKYLTEIANLSQKIAEKQITHRRAFQALSTIIRNFIYEMTDIKVQYYTLSDIDPQKLPVLYELVSEYYDPEFATDSDADVLVSINKTKQVIEKWN